MLCNMYSYVLNESFPYCYKYIALDKQCYQNTSDQIKTVFSRCSDKTLRNIIIIQSINESINSKQNQYNTDQTVCLLPHRNKEIFPHCLSHTRYLDLHWFTSIYINTSIGLVKIAFYLFLGPLFYLQNQLYYGESMLMVLCSIPSYFLCKMFVNDRGSLKDYNKGEIMQQQQRLISKKSNYRPQAPDQNSKHSSGYKIKPFLTKTVDREVNFLVTHRHVKFSSNKTQNKQQRVVVAQIV